MKIERNGTGFGWAHIVATDLPDGKLRYEHSSRTLIAQSHTSDKETEESSSYIVDRQLRPISFTTVRRESNIETRTSGERNGDAMTITVRTKDAPEKRLSVEIGDVYFGSLIENLILRDAGHRRFRLRLLDTDKCKVETSKVEIRKGAAETIEASVKDPEGLTVYRVSRDGRLLEVRLAKYGLRGYLTDAAEARKIVALRDHLATPIRSSNPFPNSFTVTSARVQLSWKRVPLSRTRFGDNRQSVIRTARSGDAFEVVLDLGTPASTQSNALPTAFLGGDKYVKPRDAAVRKASAEAIGETRDPAGIVKKLLAWVNRSVRYEIITEIRTGPQVLQKRSGRCADYAVLFASMARAAGIPTRIVVGVLYTKGIWVGHMWNEVWLAGEWIGVDPTGGELVSGPLHLKLSDDATVDGALRARALLRNEPKVEILDFREPDVDPKLKTGVTGLTYSNASFRCRIAAPDASWTIQEQIQETGGRLVAMTPKEGVAAFALVMFGVPHGVTAETVLDAMMQEFSRSDPHFQVKEKGTVEIAKRTAPSVTFSQADGTSRRIINQSVWVEGNRGYLFSCTSPAHEYDRSARTMRKILGSFELTGH
jgi:transglutaminase-like putative cysteine protease